MNYSQKFFGHLKTVCTHRWWVFYYCCKFGIPLRGIVHDLSKFHPTEFFESVKYYSGTRSPIDACKEATGYSKAWMHHKGRNRHHYEYWQDNFDNGTTHIMMPFKDTLEMLCDYLAAGRAYMKKNFSYADEFTWTENKLKTAKAMHPTQKIFLYDAIGRLASGSIPEQSWHEYFKGLYTFRAKPIGLGEIKCDHPALILYE